MAIQSKIAHLQPSQIRRPSLLICIFFIALNSAAAQTSYSRSRNTDGILAGAGLSALFISCRIDKPDMLLSENELAGLSRYSVNGIDRPATYLYSSADARRSDALVGLTAVSPAGLFLLKEIRSSAGTFTLMYFETMLLSTFIPQLFKRSIERYRPYAYNPDAPFHVRSDPDSRRSFFSGHTTSAFAFALFLSTVYSNSHGPGELKSYIWTCSILTSSIVSYLRYSSGSHFPTDIITGALAGAAIGFLVPALHRTVR